MKKIDIDDIDLGMVLIFLLAVIGPLALIYFLRDKVPMGELLPGVSAIIMAAITGISALAKGRKSQEAIVKALSNNGNGQRPPPGDPILEGGDE